MRFQVNSELFQVEKLEVEINRLFHRSDIYFAGHKLEHPYKGVQVELSDGRVVKLKLKSNYFDSLPNVYIDSDLYRVGRSLSFLEKIFLFLPFSLLLVGGLIGIILGLIAVRLNGIIIRCNLESSLKKYMLCFLTTIGAYSLYLCLALIVNIFFQT